MTQPRPARRRATGRLALATLLTAALAGTALLTGGDAGPATAGSPHTSTGISPASTDNAPSATTQAVTWSGDLAGQAPCPEGSTRRALLHRETFDSAIPQARFNNGWYRITGIQGPHSARAMVNSANPSDHMYLPYVQGSVGTRTMLAFVSRSRQPDSAYTRTQVNNVDLRVANTRTWDGRVYDITPATRTENGWLGTWFEHRSKGGAEATWDVDNLQIYTCRTAPVSRLAGSDRYLSAAEVAKTYPANQSVAYLTTGENYPDALSVSGLAGHQDAPVLLTRSGRLPAPTVGQLRRLQPQRVVIVGGTSAISTDVERAVGEYAGTVTRVTGDNRYEVSAALARSYSPGVPVLYVASGDNFPDALSVGALAGHRGAPLLLTLARGVPNVVVEEIQRLRPGRIVVVGGPSAVSESAVRTLQGLTSGTVTRIAGDDRYQVSKAVAAEFPRGPQRAYVATGGSFPDALVGAARAGSQGAPVVLSRSEGLPQASRQALDALDAARGVLLGGRTALNSLVMDQVGARVG